jgi:hypothetical protein
MPWKLLIIVLKLFVQAISCLPLVGGLEAVLRVMKFLFLKCNVIEKVLKR